MKSHPPEAEQKPIRLIVADIDGCVTRGGRVPFDLDMLRRVAGWNIQSEREEAIPALTFCTGRPLPYVQALQQACGSRVPAIAEFGAVIWDPRQQCHAVHPAYTQDDRRRYYEMLADAEETFSDPDLGVLIEAGKLCQLTLYPRPPLRVEELDEVVADFSARWREYYVFDRTPAVINYMPRAVNKGTALLWLSELSGIGLDEMAGIGDAESDWHFLQHCALSATPKNGRPMVKERCDWCLGGGPVECIPELYERVIAWNASLLELEEESAG